MRKLALTIIEDAVSNIREKVNNQTLGVFWEKDLNWVHSPHSSFPFWCEVAGIDPDEVKRCLHSAHIK